MSRDENKNVSDEKRKIADLLAENERLRKANIKWRVAQAELYQKYESERNRRLRLVGNGRDLIAQLQRRLDEHDAIKQQLNELKKMDDNNEAFKDKVTVQLLRAEHVITNLQNECNDLHAKIADMKECQICNEPFDHESRQPSKANCGHILYCKECLLQVAESIGECPACRAKFKKKDIERVNLSFV